MIRVDLTTGEMVALAIFVCFMLAVVIGGILNHHDR